MSQVVVTDDTFKDKRQKSREQEHKIARESEFGKWRRDDVTKLDRFQRVLGLMVLPIVGLWGIICGLMYFVVQIVRFCFQLLGGGQKK